MKVLVQSLQGIESPFFHSRQEDSGVSSSTRQRTGQKRKTPIYRGKESIRRKNPSIGYGEFIESLVFVYSSGRGG